MSGIEALSLVTEVMTVITFATQTVQICKTIYDGQPTTDADVYRKASSLKDATLVMETHYGTFKPSSSDERSLADMVNKCKRVANDLQKEVESIQSFDAKGKLFKSIAGSVKFLLGKSKIEKLERTLEQYETTLQTHLLVRLCTRTDAEALQQSEAFSQLGENVQYLISQYAAGHSRLLDLITLEHRKTRESASEDLRLTENSLKDHITNERKHTTDQGQRERLLRSLKFTGMNERRNLIKQSHEETFSWLLEGPEMRTNDNHDSGDQASWPNFIDWLQSDSTMFWISGKPGAGKSTLMRFLTEQEETSAALYRWRYNAQIITHFFWLLGTDLQKNVRGFWSSIAYQRLSSDPDLLDDILNSVEAARTKDELSDWSDQELRDVSLRILKSNDTPILFVVDGLDEISGADGASELLQALDDIRHALGPNVKFCLSSRPEDRFRRAFKDIPELKVHNLTRGDMRTLIEAKLPDYNSTDPGASATHNDFRRQIVRELTNKADGVFIWLILALESLKRGFENGDSEAEVLQRIEHLPKGIEELYADMWNRLGTDEPIYRATAARHLSLAIARHDLEDKTPMQIGPLFLGQLAVASSPELREAIFDYDTPFSLSTLSERCVKVQRELEVRCAGLLEISPDQWANHPVPTTSWTTFVHRTAYDYLTTTEHGSQILSASRLSQAEAQMMVIHGLIGYMGAMDRDNKDNLFWLEMYGIRVETFFECLQPEMSTILKRCSQVYHNGGLRSFYTTQDQHMRLEGDKMPFLSLALHYDFLRPWVITVLEQDENVREAASEVLHGFLETLARRSKNPKLWPVGRQRTDGFLQSIRNLLSLGADVDRPHRFYATAGLESPVTISFMTTIEMWMVQCLSSAGYFREEVLLELLRSRPCLASKTILVLDVSSHGKGCISASATSFQQFVLDKSTDIELNTFHSVPGIHVMLEVDLAFLLSTFLNCYPRHVGPGTYTALCDISEQAPQTLPQLLCVLTPAQDGKWNCHRCLEPSRAQDVVDACTLHLADYPRRWTLSVPGPWRDIRDDGEHPVVSELDEALETGILQRFDGLMESLVLGDDDAGAKKGDRSSETAD